MEANIVKSTEFEYNNLQQIEHLSHEIVTDKTLIHHDTLFKIIIIGDTGKCLLKAKA